MSVCGTFAPGVIHIEPSAGFELRRISEYGAKTPDSRQHAKLHATSSEARKSSRGPSRLLPPAGIEEDAQNPFASRSRRRRRRRRFRQTARPRRRLFFVCCTSVLFLLLQDTPAGLRPATQRRPHSQSREFVLRKGGGSECATKGPRCNIPDDLSSSSRLIAKEVADTQPQPSSQRRSSIARRGCVAGFQDKRGCRACFARIRMGIGRTL